MNPHPALLPLLVPLSWFYAAAVGWRARRYRGGSAAARRLPVTVVSVGNLTLGGTGKTPMVLWLAERLAKMRVPVGILSRGYRGTITAPGQSKPGGHAEVAASRASSSDEVRMMQRRLGSRAGFGVGPDRWRSGMALAQAGMKFLLLDDGFQHLQLGRDADIVLIDSTDPWGGGRLLPAGRLREPLSALARADIVVITRSHSAPGIEAELRRHCAAPVFYARTELETMRPVFQPRESSVAADWLGKRVFAFCGIGNPAAFFADLERWGMSLAGRMAFRDHHRYSPADARRIEAAAAGSGAEAIVCTEKDTFNLGPAVFERLQVFSCDVSMQVADAERFWNAILDAVERRCGSRPL
jgi:tetraacyldisaccharide 4'-kinase